jgi:hypothetical protein
VLDFSGPGKVCWANSEKQHLDQDFDTGSSLHKVRSVLMTFLSIGANFDLSLARTRHQSVKKEVYSRQNMPKKVDVISFVA